MTGVHMAEARKFVEDCAKLGITGPAAIAQGHAVIALAEAYKMQTPDVQVLTLSADELQEYIKDISIRSHTSRGTLNGVGMEYGIDAVKDQVSEEVRSASLPHLDALVEELRPQFDEHANTITIAVKTYGFTATTTAEQVIEKTNVDAINAWRNAHAAVGSINAIARLMERMVTLFDLRPNEQDYKGRRSGPPPVVNYSVLFALAGNWDLAGGYTLSGGDVTYQSPYVLDWYALAAGGLRLNTPSEVVTKLAGRNATEQLALRASQPEIPAP